MQKRGKNMKKLEETIRILSSGEILPERYLDHPLSGNYKGYRECHIEPDWLLVYKIDNNTLKPCWVIGLGWSHAMFIIVLEKLYGKS